MILSSFLPSYSFLNICTWAFFTITVINNPYLTYLMPRESFPNILALKSIWLTFTHTLSSIVLRRELYVCACLFPTFLAISQTPLLSSMTFFQFYTWLISHTNQYPVFSLMATAQTITDVWWLLNQCRCLWLFSLLNLNLQYAVPYVKSLPECPKILKRQHVWNWPHLF